MKKNFIKSAAIFFAALGAAACQTANIEAPAGEYSYTFEAVSATKALIGETCIEWESGDKIGTFAGGLQNNAGSVTVGEPCTFEVKASTALVPGDKVYAYYPYSEDAGTDPSAAVVMIPAAQTIGTSGFDADAMPLAAVPYEVKSDIAAGTSTPVAGMNFCNLGSVIEFRIYSNGTAAAGEKIRSVCFNASGNICGSYTVDLTSVTSDGAGITAVSGAAAVTSTFEAPVDVPAAKEDAVSCYMIVAPGTFSGYVIVTTDKSTYFKSMSSTKTFARGGLKPLALNLSDAIKLSVCVGVEGVQSFAKGETVDYTVTADGITGLSVSGTPSGWTATLEGSTLSVTAPSDDEHALEGEIVLQGTTGWSDPYEAALGVRLYGINSKADLLAFRAAHGGKDSEHAELINDAEAYAASIAPYKVDGWITLNADIEAITGDDFANSYCNFIHRLKEKFDGNGHTINLDVTGRNASTILSFFQHIDTPVKNVNFAGRMTQTAKDACVMATLAQQVSTAATMENVSSSVDITTGRKNCTIGGLLALGCAANATLKDCTYSGTIKVTDLSNGIGGIVGANTAAGKGNPSLLTIDNCVFDGKIEYTSTSHNTSSRFGGIIGDQGRYCIMQNCTNCGTMVFNLDCTQIATANGSGIGGLVGRCNATATGYTMSTTVKDCEFSGSIVFNDCNPGQPKDYIGKIIGSKLNGYQDAASTGNTETGTITYNYPDPVGSIAFADASVLSFAYGETKDIAITTDKMASLEAVAVPDGWTIDFTDWAAGKIVVTAPASGEGSGFTGAAELSLKGTDNTSITAYSTNTKTIRLFGINNVTEFAAFTTAYGNSTDTPVTSGPDIDPYLVEGEITFNTDITVPSAQIAANAYWIKKLKLPLNGNKHTITYSTTRSHRGGLFQDIFCNVRNLNLAGTITASAPTAASQFGALACTNAKSGTVIKNVNSSVKISFTDTNEQSLILGGLIGLNNGGGFNLTFDNCSVTGDIMLTGIKNNSYVGGFLGSYSADGKTAIGTYYRRFKDCIHSGKIDATMSAACDFRLGGFIGNSERCADFNACTNSGNLTIDCAGFAYSTANAGGGHGLGGFIGRQGAQVDGYDMTCILTDCTNSATICLKNAVSNAFNVEQSGNSGCVGQFVGKNLNDKTGGTYSEAGTCVKSGSVVISYK